MAVSFGAYNSKTTWNLDYLHKTINPPEPKRTTVSIPLVHGDIDLTSRLTGSEPVFENREISLYFEIRALRSGWITLYQDILGKIHGRVMDVILGEDPNYRWNGLVTVGALEDHGFTAGFEVIVTAFPFKWEKQASTFYIFADIGTTTQALTITQQIALPEFITANNLEITYNDQVFIATSTVKSPPGLMFTKGSSNVKMVGTGTVTLNIYGGYL